MRVKLISHTMNPLEVVATAARTCYSAKMPDDIYYGMVYRDSDPEAIVRHVRESGHLSTYEHASFTFAISGISRACSHQLVRHRMASYSQQSQRYVSLSDQFYTLPDTVAGDPALYETFDSAVTSLEKAYKSLVDHKVPAEDARYILPNASQTNIIVTMNARELLHFFNLRCCNRAQWEIRDLANAMLQECKLAAPVLFEQAGASCVGGHCPEGDKSCKAVVHD